MPTLDHRMVVALAIAAMTAAIPAAAQDRPLHLGASITEAQIAPWNIDISPSGEGLPPGSGTVEQGRRLFAQRCAACDGSQSEGGIGDRLVGGQGTLASPKPVKTVGSYWPYATTLYDYIHRTMPFDSPQSLTPDQVYAYVLFANGIIPGTAVMNAETLSKVNMPNRNGFIRPDPRPDIKDEPCMSRCQSLNLATPKTEPNGTQIRN